MPPSPAFSTATPIPFPGAPTALTPSVPEHIPHVGASCETSSSQNPMGSPV